MESLLRRGKGRGAGSEDEGSARYAPLQPQGPGSVSYGSLTALEMGMAEGTSDRKYIRLSERQSYSMGLDEMQPDPIPLWRDGEEVVRSVLYGLINALMLVPVSASFATIIFRHTAYAPYLPGLVRLVIFSSAVHAAVFSSLSSMHFAVGQVQDAGLIFLSAMASTVADACSGQSDRVLVSTALVLLSLATASLGLLLIIIGKLNLASVVQYLPMSVIGGYLAYIGFYMAEAGLAFMTQLPVTRLIDWPQFFHPSALLHLCPGLALGLLMYVLVHRIHHVLTLPGCMAGAVLLFYVVLGATHTSLEDARTLGWVAPQSPPAAFYDAWRLIDFTAVQWWVLPQLLPTWVALVLVVAFSSCLDVAAIETEVRKPLDYSGELRMIGISNLLSGLTGGFTGSYIFSQTIFTLRAGVRSRLCTAVVVALEVAAFVSPVSLIAYIPRFFFGGLLVLIATDLLLEWLVIARSKMMAPEYVTCICTFIAIQASNIEAGMCIGVLLAIVAFAVSYAKAPAVLLRRVRHSTVVRTFEERQILSANMDKVMTMSLRGYLFFGSSVKILNDVKQHLGQLQRPAPSPRAAASAAPDPGDGPTGGGRQRSASHPVATQNAAQQGGEGRRNASLSSSTQPRSIGGSERPAPSVVGRGRSGSHGGSGGGVTGSYPEVLSMSVGILTPVYNRGGLWPQSTPSTASVAGTPGVTGTSLQPAAGRRAMAQEEEDDDGEDLLEDSAMQQLEDELMFEEAVEGSSSPTPSGSQRSRRSPGNRSPTSFTAPHPAAGAGPIQWGEDPEGGAEDNGFEDAASHHTGATSITPSLLGEGSGGLVEHYLGHWAGKDKEKEKHEETSMDAQGGRTRWLILDFAEVTGLDATAARACFLMLKSLLHNAGVYLVFASLSDKVCSLLSAHGVVGPEDRVFETLDEALEYCEELLLRDANEMSRADLQGLSRHPSYYAAVRKSRTKYLRRRRASRTGSLMSPLSPDARGRASSSEQHQALDLESILADYLELDYVSGGEDEGGALMEFFEEIHVDAGECLFASGEASDHIYFIKSGVVELQVPSSRSTVLGTEAAPPPRPQRLMKVSDGGSFGELGFFLKRPQVFSARAVTSCHLYRLSRDAMYCMAKYKPAVCCILQMAILRSLSLMTSFAVGGAAPPLPPPPPPPSSSSSSSHRTRQAPTRGEGRLDIPPV